MPVGRITCAFEFLKHARTARALRQLAILIRQVPLSMPPRRITVNRGGDAAVMLQCGPTFVPADRALLNASSYSTLHPKPTTA